MLAPVNLYNQFLLQADKVYNKRANGMLTSKFPSTKSSITQIIPKHSFSISQAFSQIQSKVLVQGFPPHPNPLPSRGEGILAFSQQVTLPPYLWVKVSPRQGVCLFLP